MKNYDKKVKQTRILLADYLLLKSLAENAGVSMSEQLHRLIIKQAEPKPEREPVAVATKPAFRVISQPAFRVKAPATLRVRPQPILTTNGHKAGVFVIKPKGGILND